MKYIPFIIYLFHHAFAENRYEFNVPLDKNFAIFVVVKIISKTNNIN
jgi:hypothetical protein